MTKRYGEYEQVNGAVCNDLADRIEELEALLESEDSAHTSQINKLEARIKKLIAENHDQWCTAGRVVDELQARLEAFKNGIDTDWMKDSGVGDDQG